MGDLIAMSTDVYMFLLPLPSMVNYYREAHAYGPDGAGGFYTDLAIEIDPMRVNPYARALAAVSGLIRFIPDPDPATGTLVLTPELRASRDLSVALGGAGSVVFVYRNLDTASVRVVALPIIQALGDAPFLTSETPDRRADSFAAGDFAISVRAGAELGVASTIGGSGGWARLGFEIAYVSKGLGPEGWNRLKKLIDRSALTRRLDPMAFYAAVASGSGPATLNTAHAQHILLRVPTRSTLVEVRNEYDEPFPDPVTIQAGGTSTTEAARPGSRGTFVVDTLQPGNTANNVAYTVTIPNRVLTSLPSGDSANSSPTRSMKAPAQWALQAIFMADADDSDNWFVANGSSGPLGNVLLLPRFTENNKVTAIRDGIDTFREYASAMRTVTGVRLEPGARAHFIYLAGWRLIDNFELVAGDPGSTAAALTSAAATHGAEVRAMIWDDPTNLFPPPGNVNTPAVDHINALPGGQAILDNETLTFGAHHQKFLVINGARGAFAFCGGVDINPDRRDSPNHGALGAFHDVHAKVEGPAVGDIHRTFVERWNFHPRRQSALDNTPPPFETRAGKVYVQVACTFAPRKRYPFARDGSLTPLSAFLRAINKARKFIYIEDQYLTPYPGGSEPPGPDEASVADDTVGVLRALREALPRISYLIIVIPNHTDQPAYRRRRWQFVEGLRAIDPNKVHVFFLAREFPRPKRPGEVAEGPDSEIGELATEGGCPSCSGGRDHRDEIYCHSKVWIVDDVCAKIGSCNVNRRGYTFDTEMDLVMVDGAVDGGARAFVRRFRLDLWGEHLNLKGARNALLEDHMLAHSFWISPPPGARIRSWVEATKPPASPLSWDRIDPDGR
jgi:phosphatidylserine/phosphatidylglycerophosphate/cardiolipin synthase-like enzyme